MAGAGYSYTDQSSTPSSAGSTIGGNTIVFPSGSISSTPAGFLGQAGSIGQQIIIGVVVAVLVGVVIKGLHK